MSCGMSQIFAITDLKTSILIVCFPSNSKTVKMIMVYLEKQYYLSSITPTVPALNALSHKKSTKMQENRDIKTAASAKIFA